MHLVKTIGVMLLISRVFLSNLSSNNTQARVFPQKPKLALTYSGNISDSDGLYDVEIDDDFSSFMKRQVVKESKIIQVLTDGNLYVINPYEENFSQKFLNIVSIQLSSNRKDAFGIVLPADFECYAKIVSFLNGRLHFVYSKMNPETFQKLLRSSLNISGYRKDSFEYSAFELSISIENKYFSEFGHHNQVKKDISAGAGIDQKTLEKMTSSDACLDRYFGLTGEVSQGAQDAIGDNGKFTNTATDDNIVNIIPKFCFQSSGKQFYIGKEYGFFIDTVKIGGDEYESNFIVFDIENQRVALNEPGKVTVRPVLNGFTYYDQPRDSVYRHREYGSDLALSDIAINLNLRNVNGYDYGTSGYSYQSDYGYFFDSYSVKASGVVKKGTTDKKFDIRYLKFVSLVAKFFPPLEPYYPLIKVATNVLLTGAQKIYEHYCPTTVQDRTVTFSEMNLGESNVYGYSSTGRLPKDLGVLFQNENQDKNKDPILYKTSQDYFGLEYSVAQHNSDINWDAALASTIGLNVVKDNTGTFLWWENGSIDRQWTASITSSNTKTNIIYFNKVKENETVAPEIHTDEEVFVEYGSGVQRKFLFCPREDAEYVFETYLLRGSGDTVVSVLDENNQMVGSNDDSGVNFHASRAQLRLSAGKRYFVIVKDFNSTRNASSSFIVYKFIGQTNLEDNLTSSKPYQKDITVTSSQKYWIDFRPENDMQARLFLSKNGKISTEASLEVYDKNYQLVGFTHQFDYRKSIENQCEVLLKKSDTVYHIAIQKTTFGEENYHLNLFPFRVVTDRITGKVAGQSISYSLAVDKHPLVIDFYSIYGGNYHLWTSDPTGTYTDLVLYVLDEDMNTLISADDTNGNQPSLRFSFTKDWQYYLLIRQYSITSNSTTGFTFHMEA